MNHLFEIIELFVKNNGEILTIFVILQLLDIISGISVGIFEGKLFSKTMSKGLFNKVYTNLLFFCIFLFDYVAGIYGKSETHFAFLTIIIFGVKEFLSIMENFSYFGIRYDFLPKQFQDFVTKISDSTQVNNAKEKRGEN